jgi:hypothetical protein
VGAVAFWSLYQQQFTVLTATTPVLTLMRGVR